MLFILVKKIIKKAQININDAYSLINNQVLEMIQNFHQSIKNNNSTIISNKLNK